MTAKKIHPLLAALLLGISGLAHSVLDCDMNDLSVSPSNGKVGRESTYINGDEIGLVRTFYASGMRRSVSFNVEGRREAASANFTEAGQLSALRCADKPMLAPAFDDTRACGFSDGPSQVELFDGKGKLRERVSYGAGKRLHWQGIYDNGQPETSGDTVGDQSIGRRFWPNGLKRHEVYSLAIGQRTVRQRELAYSERGTLVHEQRWSVESVPTNDNSFYLNGQPRSKSVYLSDGAQRFVDISAFYDSGERSAVGRFRAGPRGGGTTPVCTHQTFDTRDLLATETNYDDKGSVTREREFDEGKLKRDDEVFEDRSGKAFAK